ncbi:MAG TPA: hypothetical protein VNM45_19315 [Bacillus sp. (in: firmicutes)]|nr:hypothetical protein [Bacillus sp. (in: firmicutes)]
MKANKTKKCTRCKTHKRLDDFGKQQGGKYGKKGYCKKCNQEEIKQYQRKRQERIKLLPNTLTEEQAEEIKKDFNYACALTGKDENVQLDHFIPILWGESLNKYEIGGTTWANMIPINRSLNSSKGAMNPFIWIERYHQRHNIDLIKWQEAVQYVASKYNMTAQEFKKNIDLCYNEYLIMRWINDINEEVEKENGRKGLLMKQALRMGINIDLVVRLHGNEKAQDFIQQLNEENRLKEMKASLLKFG